MPSTYTKAVISQKLEDRFLTTQVIEPEESEKATLGTLFALVEINRPWYPNAQIGQTIINTLKREYYKAKSTSDLENLETALKKVNETLARITETGETDWIGHLSSVVALRVDRQVHLASAGQARAYLLRQGKLAEISEPSVRIEEPHPLATFSSIVSGEVQQGDAVLLGSPALYDHFDKATLKELLADESSFQAAANIIKRLPKDKRRSLNFLVISETNTPEEFPRVVYLDEAAGATQAVVKDFFNKQFLPALEVAAEVLERGASQAAKYFREKVLPESKRLGKIAYERTKHHAVPLVRQALDKSKRTVKEISAEEEPAKTSLIGKHLFTVHDYQGYGRAKQSDGLKGFRLKGLSLPTAKLAQVRISPQVSARLTSVGHSLLVRLKNFIKDARQGRRRSHLLVIGALALAVVLIFSIAAQRSRSGSRARFQDQKERLGEAKRQAEEGKTALIFGQQAQAQKLFADALEGARFAAAHAKLREESESVISEVETQLDKLTATTRFKELKPLLDVGALVGMAEFDSKVWGFNDSGGLLAANLLEGQIEPAVAPEKAVQVVTTTKQDNKLLGLTSEEQLVVAHLKDKTVKIAPPLEGASLKPARDIKTFAGNLYLLDPSGNQIWRYPLSDEGYKPGAPFFKKGPDLGKSVAMAIDGSIYVLSSDGKIAKYLKGEKQALDLARAPKPDESLSEAKKIFADSDSLSIFILDNVKDRPRLVEFGKDGKYIHSYVFSLPQIDDLYLTARGRKAWLLSQGKLYEVNL